MPVCEDLREYLELLEEHGEVARVRAEVDPRNFELSSLIRHMEDGPNKALLFEKVKGYDIPVVANLFASAHRLALGVGVEPTEEEILRHRLDPHGTASGALGGKSLYEFTSFTMSDRDRAEMILVREKLLAAEAKAARGGKHTRLVSTGPCKEVIITKDLDLTALLPVVWHCERDAGPYINPAGLVQRDPDSGVLNVGVRRHLVSPERYGKDRMGAFIIEHTDGGNILRRYEELGKPCPVALCIGLDPYTELVANYTSPHFVHGLPYSEFDIAGAWMGKPLEMVKCETVDLEVPANTEIVIEGYIPPGERIYEGPMAEFTDMYAWQGPTPFIVVTAITHRRNPIYHDLMDGRTQEDIMLGAVSSWGFEQKALERVKKAFPSVKDLATYAGSFVFHLVVSMKQRFEGEDRLLLHYLLSTTFYKYITIVDDDIEPHNSEQVEWARAMRAGRSADDYVIMKTHTFEMDPESDKTQQVWRLGLLATLPFGEKYVKTGPPQSMLKATRPLFDREVLGR